MKDSDMGTDSSKETIEKAGDRLRRGECTAVELASGYLSVIDERDKDVDAYLEVFDDVKKQAESADARIADGTAGPLTGIPLAIKDNILIKGRINTAGSKILEGYRATYDATVISKLKDAGAVFLGRTNLDEVAMGSSTEHSAWKQTKNPSDLKRVPGGSSGGSAAAVAMGGALASLGSDTGGSIRQPASYCGVVGLKPTYGSVSRSGLIAMGSSLDVIGPLTHSVSDAELLYTVISGRDPLDSTSRDPKHGKASPRTIGVPRHFLSDGVDDDVLLLFEETLKKLEGQGYEIRDIELPSLDYALAAYYIVMPAEASSNLARFDGVKYGLHKDGDTLLQDYTKTRGEGFGPEVRRRILLGTYILSSGYYDAYYVRAQQVRRLIAEDFDKAFNDVDVVVTPTTPSPAFLLGEKNDPLSMYLTDIFTVPANLTGMPAISVPVGTVERGDSKLSVGFQILAPHLEESRLFSVGSKIEV